jgi:uncharacterized small protein (DUF1192 family)
VKIGELLYYFQCEIQEKSEGFSVFLRTSEIFDEIGDAQKFLDQRFVKVRFLESTEKITEFSLEFKGFQVAEICEIEWIQFFEKIVFCIIRIQLNNARVSSSEMKISWIPEKVENLDIRTASFMVFNIFSYSYTNPVEFQYKNHEFYEQDKNLLKQLQNNSKTEDLFCLYGAVFDDEASKITFQEPIESNDLEIIIESLKRMMNTDKNFGIGNIVAFTQTCSKFLKVSVENFVFFSISLVKQSENTFSDLLSVTSNENRKSFSEIIQDKINSLNKISFSMLAPVEKIKNHDNFCIKTCFSKENSSQFLYNYHKFRALRHKNLVKVIGIQELEEKYGLVTENLERISFEDQIKPLSEKEKLKILKTLASLLDFCQARGYFFIGLDPNNLFFDKNRKIKVGLCYFERLSDDNLNSYEEMLGLVARNTENYRLGLMIKKMFLEKDPGTPVTVDHDSWLTGSIPVFTEEVLRENPFMCQMVTELTNIDPARRLECKNLLENLENR